MRDLDPSGVVARPLPVIEPPDARVVAEIVRDQDVGVVVVGLPVGLSGSEGAQAGERAAFVTKWRSWWMCRWRPTTKG